VGDKESWLGETDRAPKNKIGILSGGAGLGGESEYVPITFDEGPVKEKNFFHLGEGGKEDS